MVIINKYVKHTKISESKTRQILHLFSVDINAKQSSQLNGLNRNTVNRFLKEIHMHLARICKKQSPFHEKLGIDESYFGAQRINSQRGRGGRGETVVSGIFKRNGKIYRNYFRL